MKLKGVCIHHDAGCLGAAVPKKYYWRYRLKQLKEIGCNAIRMSHNPQASCVYELCDDLGMLVDDEAFDEWGISQKEMDQRLEYRRTGIPRFRLLFQGVEQKTPC